MPQLAQRLRLDLPDALPRDGEAPADFFQRVLAFLTDPEPEPEDLLLLRRQGRKRPLDLRRQVLGHQRVVRRPRRLVLQEVPELRVLADRRFQRERLPGRLEDQPDFLRRHAGPLGQLLRRGLPAHLVHHVPVHAGNPVQRLDHVHRDPDRPGVVGDGACDRLTNPPGGVRRELEPPAVLEPVHRLHQADVAFLNEVQQ